MIPEPDPILSIGSGLPGLPPWMNPNSATSSNTSTPSVSLSSTPSVSLSLSPSDPGQENDPTRMGVLQWCREVEEGRQCWVQHKKEATWRLSRLEQQLEAEKARKRREAVEEARIRGLREEEAAFVARIESDYRNQMCALQREAETKEAMLVEAWCTKHAMLARIVEQIHSHNATHGGFT